MDITGTKVGDLAPLATLSKIEYLHLDNTPVSDVAPLANMDRMQRLTLSNTNVSDVTALKKFTDLWGLDLRKTAVSATQVKSLRQALPNCMIEWVPLPPPLPQQKGELEKKIAPHPYRD